MPSHWWVEQCSEKGTAILGTGRAPGGAGVQPPGGAAPEPGICPGSLVLTPVPYFPVVSADQTPAAHARLNFPQEARGGLPATRSPRREDPAVSQEGRSWRWLTFLAVWVLSIPQGSFTSFLAVDPDSDVRCSLLLFLLLWETDLRNFS